MSTWASSTSLGGVGVNYKPEQEPNDIAIIGERCASRFDAILKPAGLGHVKIYTELGRFMLASHGLLVTRVTQKRKPTGPMWASMLLL